jgi:DNA-directed RNA polymerase specialized sigma24 family protein
MTDRERNKGKGQPQDQPQPLTPLGDVPFFPHGNQADATRRPTQQPQPEQRPYFSPEGEARFNEYQEKNLGRMMRIAMSFGLQTADAEAIVYQVLWEQAVRIARGEPVDIRKSLWSRFTDMGEQRARRERIIEHTHRIPDAEQTGYIDSRALQHEPPASARLDEVIRFADLKEKLRAGGQGLSDHELEALILESEGFNGKEIASQLGIPESTAYHRLERAKEKAREILEEEKENK